MKKSLIALAVLAAAGAASAQSSVSLYGLADVYVGSVKNTIANPGSKTQTAVNSSGLNNSRWGLRGSEDLGNGLKANFVLEAGFETDTGAAGSLGSTFQRKSTVGLSGAFGSVELGRNYTAYDTLRAVTNNTADTNVAVTNEVWQNGSTYNANGTINVSADYANRVSNSIRFDSAVYGGFSGSVAYGFGEDKTATTDATDNLSLHVKYANGPLLVGYAYQQQNTANSANKDTKFNLLAGSYDFGVAKLVAGYNTVKRQQTATLGGEDKEYQFGVQAPLGAVTLYAGYANSENETTGGVTVSERSGYNLAATYALSKRTTAYAGYKNIEIDSGAGKGNEINAFAVGVRHTF